ncbi:penicillin-binding protein 2 [Patescibacteria group bacterium]
MSNPFKSVDNLLWKNKYNIKPEQQAGDGFFIDKRYQGKIGLNIVGKKIDYFLLLVFLFILIFFIRVYYLQVIEYQKYSLIAEGNRIKTEILPAARGIFFDRNNQRLVENVPKFSLFIENDYLSKINQANKDKLFEKIFFLTKISFEEIEEKIQSQPKNQDVLISQDIEYHQAILFKTEEKKYLGLKLQLTPERKYLYPLSSSHFLGYLGKINVDEWQRLKKENYQIFDLLGKTGLEKQYEETLRGLSGRTEEEVDATGNFVKTLNYINPLAGENLILTIDQKLNQKFFNTLKEQLETNNKTKGVGIAMDPRTGEILAMVSFPAFNNNYFSNIHKYSDEVNNILQDTDQPLFNRVIAGEYPSGSTFKLVLAAAGLQEKIISEWTSVLSVGGIQIDKWFFPDWKQGGHGLTSIAKALAESVNTFFYYLGGGYKDFKGLGLEKIVSYAQKFGFGNYLGIDLPGEAPGFLPSREWKEETKGEPWYIGDTYHLAIGQGDILATPLQISSLTSVIANSGKLFQPYLVKEIVSIKNISSAEIKPKIIKQNFIDRKNIEIVKKGLRQAVISGSAISLNSLSISSAGKTGTAQVGGEKDPHAWFTVFAPYENPEIVITVLIENGGDGSAIALPVAKQILKWYFND